MRRSPSPFTYCSARGRALPLISSPRERLRSIVMSMSVCLSVSPRGYFQNRTRDLYQIFVHVAYVPGSVTIGRIAYCREGVSSPLKMHYRPGKGEGSAQRGRSMLSTIALFAMCNVLRRELTALAIVDMQRVNVFTVMFAVLLHISVSAQQISNDFGVIFVIFSYRFSVK